MKIFIVDSNTGKVNKMDLPVTLKQIDRWLFSKEKMKDIFPHLSKRERRFIATGIIEDEK